MFWPLRLPIYCHDLNQYIVSGTKTHQYRKLDCILIFREKDITILLLTTFDTFNVIFKGYKKYLFKFKDIYNCMLNSIKMSLHFLVHELLIPKVVVYNKISFIAEG